MMNKLISPILFIMYLFIAAYSNGNEENETVSKNKRMKKIYDVKKLLLFLYCTIATSLVSAQDTIQEPIPVLTLGTFHFDFPNLDRIQYNNDEIIDVSESKYQAEIEELVNALSEFSPTIIVIERPVKMQHKIDSLFRLYQTGKYVLQRGEYEQIGFRLARKLDINRIYCVDEWGKHYENIGELLKDENSESYIRFEDSFIHHSDSTKEYYPKPVFQKQGIISELMGQRIFPVGNTIC